LLRSKGKSYVCDVNGFSFVKTSKKYYQDCANQIRKIIMRKLEIKWSNPYLELNLKPTLEEG
jgi:inositol hexakisphosphate/diphosphoinositol-pentakisphosphate kinase